MNGLFKSSLAVLLVVGYSLASHLALTLPGGQTIAAVLAIGIPAIIAIVWIFQWVFNKLTTKTAETVEKNMNPLSLALRLAGASAVAIAPVLVFLYATWPLMLANAEAVYFAQHVGTNGLLAWVFGRTLVVGVTPLIVTFAKLVHPVLPKEIGIYARKVTVAWTWFFVLTCGISVILYFAAPLSAWSAFAILLQWPSVALFFVGEYLLRKKLFKKFDHATLRQGFDAYRQSQTTSMNAVNVVKAEQSQ
jgi:uncharacterized membrane protein